jgi:demethylmenaquinone methyltransferase/2-methoxy-6-polyprenyl-1,4-benzoquinol methylase
MFDVIAPRYETVNALMAMGMDRGWRRACVHQLDLPPGSRVLDVACGTGDLCRQLAADGYRPTGVDLSRGMLARARTSAALVLGDALSSPLRSGAFDGAVSGFALRNVVDLSALFAELARVVRPGGRVSLLDMSQPDNPVLRAGHHLWTNYAVPAIGAVLSDAESYRYLPRSLAYLPPPAHMSELLRAAGFRAVERHALSGGITQLYVATRSETPAP